MKEGKQESSAMRREGNPDPASRFSWLKAWKVRIFGSVCLFVGFLVGMFIFGSPWHLPPNWGDIPTWISAIATVGLLVGAIITAIYAAKAFGAQATELAVLKDQRDRDSKERRRAQAAKVFIGVPHNPPRMIQPYAQNASDYPIFDAQFWYSGEDGIVGPDDLGPIMPGPVVHNGRQMPEAEAREHAILTFRDAEGIRWVRMPDGTFDEQKHPAARESVFAALGLPLPDAAAES
jgi:hypothetical protein